MRMNTPVWMGLILSSALASASAYAETDVELSLTPLEYSVTKSDADLDTISIKTDKTELRSLDPNLGIEIFGDHIMATMAFAAGQDATSGTFAGGYEVAPKVYAGLLLEIENTKTETTQKIEATGVETESKEEKKFLGVGPYVYYRAKTTSSIVQAYAALLNASQTETSDAVGTDDTTKIKIMSLSLGGDYYVRLIDRLYVGAGLNYQMSLSGDYSDESNGAKIDGDYKSSSLTVSILEARIAL